MRKGNQTFYLGLIASGSILLMSLVAGMLQPLDGLNNSIYDLFSRHSPPAIPPEQRSLLIECLPEQSQWEDTVWLDLLAKLEGGRADQIIFTFFPQGASERFYAQAARNKKIYFGRNSLLPQDPAESPPLEAIPANVGTNPLQTAAQTVPSPRQGVYRSQYATVLLGQGQAAPHLVRLAAEARRGKSLTEDDIFMINFNGMPPESQPRLDLSQALEGNLIPSLVRGKSVFIGLKNDSPFSGLLTPMASDSQLVSQALFITYSFDSLLTERAIRKAGPLPIFFLFAICILSGIMANHYLKTGLTILVLCTTFVLSALLAWLWFVFGRQQIPLLELQLGQLLLLLMVVVGKALLIERNIREVAFTTKVQLQERLLPDTIYSSPQYWLQIVGMVSQILNLDRSIFLESVRNDHRVREVAAANSSIEEIVERRRDYHRTPYSTALEENGVIEVKNYLITSVDGEHQYLTPLRIADGEVLGFWACSVTPEQYENFADLLPKINTFAAQISELLLGRKLWQDERKRLKNPVRKILNLEGEIESFMEINEAFSLLTKRLDAVESVFNNLATGAVLYDLFGQVVYANKKITSLCQEFKVSPFKLSSSELIVFLTGEILEDVRRTLVDLLFNDEKATFHTRKLGDRQTVFVLTVRTMSGSPEAGDIGRDRSAQLLRVRGILLEMHELTDVNKIMRFNKLFFDLSSKHFQTYEKAYPPVLQKLRDPQLSQEAREKLINFLEKRLAMFFDYIGRLGHFMTQNMLTGEVPFFPTDFEECLQAALVEIATKASSKKVQIDLQVADTMVPVLAVPDELQTILQDILRYLIDDAEPNSTIHIRFQREYKFIDCHMQNRGFGMPDHDFQEYLTEDDSVLSPEFKSLTKARERLLRCEGQFAATSELGKGTSFSIGLKRFQ